MSTRAAAAGSLARVLLQPPVLPRAEGRIEAIDLARGIAIALMIMSHSVSGLLGIDQVPDWGMVPVHLITKFSSSLFITVFGIALAVAFLPKANTPDWPRRRRKLLLRGLEVLFWYKVLTVVEMMPLYTSDDILDTLLYQRFPIWVEILGFYALALLWIPWMLPLWGRTPLWLRLVAPIAVAVLAGWLERHVAFWGVEPIKALLVEDDAHYTWGQLSRLPLVMLGLLIGESILRGYWQTARRGCLITLLAISGGLSLLGCVAVVSLSQELTWVDLARNVGKHPPALPFMSFSLGGALVILALALWGGERLACVLRPLTIIGSDALKAFTFHIVVIFLGLRFLLESWQVFSYPQVLMIGVALILTTAVWIRGVRWLRESA
nr:heparan-alpha-glucosaminide N-acetyltransferase domain-containing protein [Aidingimonas lacisalsi]